VTRVVVASLADQDSAEIFSYLALEAGWRVVQRYAADFDRLYDLLGRFPKSGARRPRLGRRVRIGVVFPYVVIYEYADRADVVTILRILHGRRKASRNLLR